MFLRMKVGRSIKVVSTKNWEYLKVELGRRGSLKRPC